MEKNVSKSPNSPQELTWNVYNTSSESSDESFSLRVFSDDDSIIIEEEIDKMLHDIEDCGSIPLTDNLSQVLEYSPLETRVKMECLSEEDKVDKIQQDQDQLLIDNEKKNNEMKGEVKDKEKDKEVKDEVKHEEIDNEEKDYTKVENVKSIGRKKSTIKSTSKEIKIELQHIVPPQHKIENTAGSRQLTSEQVKEFENYGPLKKGPFTKQEDQCIEQNWKNFCKVRKTFF